LFAETKCQNLTNDDLGQTGAPFRRELAQHNLFFTGETGSLGGARHHWAPADAPTLAQQLVSYRDAGHTFVFQEETTFIPVVDALLRSN
jgi:hypothetical protein